MAKDPSHIDWTIDQGGSPIIDPGNYTGGSGTDTDAIHDNVSGEIALISEKTIPASTDLLIIEDSEAGDAKKRLQIGNLVPIGRITGEVRKGCRARPALNLTAINATGGYLVPCDSEDFDNGGWHDNVTNNTRFTVPAGVSHVDITASIRYELTSSGAWHVVNILKNGTDRIAQNYSYGNTSLQIEATALHVSVIEGDYFEISAANTTDTSVTITAAETYMTIMESIEYIGAVPAEALTTAVSSADSDVGATNGVRDVITMSGFTADHNWTLPSSSSVGNRYGVATPDGNATFELLIKTGAVGSLIDGVDYSTNEFTRLFIAGESLTFVCVDGSGPAFIVEVDGRKPCICDHWLSIDADGEAASTYTVPTAAPTPGVWTQVKDNGNLFSASNSTFTPRRNGSYTLQAGAQGKDFAAGNYILRITDGTTRVIVSEAHATSTSVQLAVARTLQIAAGIVFTYSYFSSAGGVGLSSFERGSFFSVAEQL